MDEVMKEYKTCPECNHPWVSSHFQDGAPCPCKECGCQWALTIKILHGLADDMVDREGKPLEVKAVPMPEMDHRGGIEEKARKPVITGRLWIWLIVGILILFIWVKWTRDHRDHEVRSLAEQAAGGQVTRELLEEVIRLVEEERYEEIPDLIPGS